jgi:hypothetical protein
MIYELDGGGALQPRTPFDRYPVSAELLTVADVNAPIVFQDKYRSLDMPSLCIGRRVHDVEVPRIPTTLRQLGRRWKKFPHVSMPAGQWLVSQTFKDIVESLDPGFHQFFPVTIINDTDGRAYDEFEPYYFWNCCLNFPLWELVDIEKTIQKGGAVTYQENERNGHVYRSYNYKVNTIHLVSKVLDFNSRNFCWISRMRDNDGISHSGGRRLLASQRAFNALRPIDKGSLRRTPIETSV